MTVKVSWPRQAVPMLRFPPVCPATGGPATTRLRMLFRKEWTIFLPGIGRLVMSITSPPVMMEVPVSAETAAEIRKWRLVSLAGGLGAIVLGILLAVVLRNVVGSAMFWLGLIAGLGLAIFGGFRADVIGADVDGQTIMITKAHPSFAQALVQANPPGMVQVGAGAYPPPYGHPPYHGQTPPPHPSGPHQQGPPAPYAPGPQGGYQPGPYQPGPAQQAPYQQGAHPQGPYQQGPHQQGPYQQGPYQQGPYQQGQHQQGQPHQAPPQWQPQTPPQTQPWPPQHPPADGPPPGPVLPGRGPVRSSPPPGWDQPGSSGGR